MMKNIRTAALLAALAVPAHAGDAADRPKFESKTIELKTDQWLRVNQDKGRITVIPTGSGQVQYEVYFKPDGGKTPSRWDLWKSDVAYSPDEGLVIRSGGHVSAQVTLRVPADQSVDLQLKTGLIEIGRLTGRIEARVQTGELDYDARSLPKGTCVNASASEGNVDNDRDFDCRPGSVNLHVHTGTVEVK